MATPPNVQAFLDQINASGRDFAARNPGAPAENRVTWYYDEGRGALYHVDGTGRKVYENVPGVASPNRPDGGGLVHGNSEWNQQTGKWDVPIDWGKVGSWAVGSALGVGALDAAGVFGGAAGGAGGGAAYGPPTSLASGTGGLLPNTANPAAFGIGPNIAPSASPGVWGGGYGAASGLVRNPPGGGPPSNSGTDAPVGQSLVDRLTNPRNLASLLPLLMAATNRGGGGNGGAGGAGDFAQMPQLNSLLDMTVNRAQRTDPLHQAVTQLAMSRLPTSVQR